METLGIGVQAGEDKVVDIVTDTIFKLRTYGYGLTLIGHTKVKGKKDEMEDVEYELLTSNLPAKYYNAIKDKVNLVGTAYIEREYVDLKTARDAYTKGDKLKGRIASEKRVVTFRDEEHAIDVKSHFPNIVSKCEFNAQSVIKAIKDAINAQIEKQYGAKANIEEMKKQQQEEVMKQVSERIQEAVSQEFTVEEYYTMIKEAIALLSPQEKKSVVDKIKDAGLTTKYNEIEDLGKLKQFLEIVSSK